MSEIPRHSGALYTPPDAHPPPPSMPRWNQQRRSSSLSSRQPRPSRRSSGKGKRNALIAKASRLQRWAHKRINKMTLMQKIFGSLVLLVMGTTALLGLIFHAKILHAILPFAAKLRSWKAGWLLIFALCFASAFPPMIGYSTSVTLAGFVYGFPNGWFIIASATVIGATCAFMVCRYYLQDFAKRMVATDKRFAALSLTLKHDGIKLLCMIRLCPLPYSISNGALSTFPTVSPLSFMIATAVATPKLLIHIFIGAKLAELAEEEDKKMDSKTKALNYGSIIGGIFLGIVTGWLIYKRTMFRAKQLEAEERARIRTPIGQGFTDTEDPDAEAAAGLVEDLIEGEYSDSDDDDESEEDDILLDGEDDEDPGFGMEGSLELERNNTKGRSEATPKGPIVL
ncbi:hypothetical protein L873DRAFT_1735954 [Choiromyces venosus 120613-1]|uniref:Golgi apparatus membrane protein TVP38 n=1 Tax=Choiromyces venosus 120613-1 TaxID=1336337 RepID=A0A3N4JRB1_9PEZI|nr:hypothetical protein L873DRAFT_1735954 [Choiromyces venosus 120613-1]